MPLSWFENVLVAPSLLLYVPTVTAPDKAEASSAASRVEVAVEFDMSPERIAFETSDTSDTYFVSYGLESTCAKSATLYTVNV